MKFSISTIDEQQLFTLSQDGEVYCSWPTRIDLTLYNNLYLRDNWRYIFQAEADLITRYVDQLECDNSPTSKQVAQHYHQLLSTQSI